MDLSIRKGSTNRRIPILITSSVTGNGLAGLTDVSPGLVCHYWREDDADVGATAISLVNTTRGIYTSGGFIQKDGTNMAGWYEFSIPDAVLVDGSRWAKIRFEGATNMNPLDINLELDGVKNEPLAELLQGIPSVNPIYDEALMALYMCLFRGEVNTTNVSWKVKNNAGQVIFSRTLGESGGVFTRGQTGSGP
jgi:hypothetical protein